MNEYIRKRRFIIYFFVVFSVIFIGITYHLLTPKKILPIYNPAMVNPGLVDSTVQHIAKNHKIADFSFVNQNGETITQETFRDKIYVADFFFTTCPTICPIMKDNMVILQNKIKNLKDVMLLSHTVMPDIDSVSVLKSYAQKKGVDDKIWHLVTGDKKDIFYIARQSYLAVETADSSELYDMVHTENFVLVDKKRQVRGFYDGTKLEEIDRLYQDILFLIDSEKAK
jgi:protein SCO1/2